MNTCQKVAFRTLEAAEVRAYELRIVYHYPMGAYACPRCRAYHLYTVEKSAATERAMRIRLEADYWLHRLEGSRGHGVMPTCLTMRLTRCVRHPDRLTRYSRPNKMGRQAQEG